MKDKAEISFLTENIIRAFFSKKLMIGVFQVGLPYV